MSFWISPGLLSALHSRLRSTSDGLAGLTGLSGKLFSVVVLEDSAAIAGVIVAFLGVFLGQRRRSPVPDGIALILIGFMLAGVAVFLADKSKD